MTKQAEDQPIEETETAPEAAPSREAAKYRKRLREVEQERDALTEQLNTARGEMLRSAALELKLKDGQSLVEDAFSDAGLTPESFFTEGKLDTTKLTVDLEALAAEKSYLFAKPKVHVPNTWDRPDSKAPGNTWESSFKPTQ